MAGARRRGQMTRHDRGIDRRPGAERVSGVVPGLPNLHSHAFQRAMAGLTERRGGEADSFWTWREADVPLRRTADARRPRGDRGLRLHGDARGGLHLGGRVPLPASPARRPALRQRGRDVGAHRGRRRYRRHRSHAAAGALSPGRLRRQAAERGAAPLRLRPRRLRATDGDQGAGRHDRHRAAFAARRDAGRSQVGGRDVARASRRTSMSASRRARSRSASPRTTGARSTC